VPSSGIVTEVAEQLLGLWASSVSKVLESSI